MDQFGLVEAVDRLGQGVVVASPACAACCRRWRPAADRGLALRRLRAQVACTVSRRPGLHRAPDLRPARWPPADATPASRIVAECLSPLPRLRRRTLPSRPPTRSFARRAELPQGRPTCP